MAKTVHGKKQKGRRLEQFVINALIEQGLELYGYVRADSGSGAKKEDVTCQHAPLFIECKNQESWKVMEWFGDAQSKNLNSDKITTLVLAKNRLEPHVFITFNDFLKLLHFAQKGGLYELPVTGIDIAMTIAGVPGKHKEKVLDKFNSVIAFPKPSKITGMNTAQQRYKLKKKKEYKQKLESKVNLRTIDSVQELIDLGETLNIS